MKLWVIKHSKESRVGSQSGHMPKRIGLLTGSSVLILFLCFLAMNPSIPVIGVISTSAVPGHTGDILSVAYAPDGKTIITGSADHTAILWDAQTGWLLHTLQGHTDAVYSVAYAPDGKTVITRTLAPTAIS